VVSGGAGGRRLRRELRGLVEREPRPLGPRGLERLRAQRGADRRLAAVAVRPVALLERQSLLLARRPSGAEQGHRPPRASVPGVHLGEPLHHHDHRVAVAERARVREGLGHPRPCALQVAAGEGDARGVHEREGPARVPAGAQRGDRPLVELLRPAQVSAPPGDLAQVVEQHRLEVGARPRPRDRERLGPARLRGVHVALLPPHDAQRVEDDRDRARLAELAVLGEALLEQRARAFVLAGHGGDLPRGLEPTGTRRRDAPGVGFQRGVDPAPPLGEVAAHVPEPVQRARHPEQPGGVAAAAGRPLQRGGQVLVLPLQPVEPDGLLRLLELRPGALGELEEDVTVAVARSGLLSGLDEPLEGVLPDGGEHPVAGAPVGVRLGRHERVVHERGQRVQHVLRRQVRTGADRLRRLERPASREDRAAPQARALGGGEHVVAQVHHRPQAAVPLRRRPPRRAEQPEPVVQPRQDLLRRERPHPLGRQLQGQGQTVQTAADARDRGGVPLREDEVGADQPRALHEEPHRLRAPDLGRDGARAPPASAVPCARGGLRRHLEAAHGPDRFARHAQRHAARGEHLHAGAGAEHRLHGLRARRRHPFALVQHEEQATRRERGHDRLERRPSGGLANARRGGDGLGNGGRIRHGGEVREPHAVRVVRGRLGREPAGETRLAAAAGPGEGEEARAFERPAQGGEVRLAADEARRLQRKAEGRRLRGPRRRDPRREVGVDELEDPFRLAEVAQAVEPQVAQRRAIGEVVAREAGGGEREEGLSAVRGGQQPGGAVQGGPEVVAPALLRPAGVERRADAQRLRAVPGLAGDPALRFESGGDSLSGPLEDGAEGVAGGREHAPAAGLDRVPQDGVVARQGRTHPLGALLPEARAALDVGEEEREGGARRHRAFGRGGGRTYPGERARGSGGRTRGRRPAHHVPFHVPAGNAGGRTAPHAQ
jgi:hypothetical protein